MPLEHYLTTMEAAKKLNVQPSRVRHLLKVGRLEGVKKGEARGLWLVTARSVEKFERLKRGRPSKSYTKERG